MSEVGVLADDYWAYYRDTSQLWNIDRGDVDEIDRWEDLSGAGVAARIQTLGDFNSAAERAATTDPPDGDLSLLAAVSFSSAASAVSLPWMRNRLLVSGGMNFATFLSVLVPSYGLETRRHGAGYIAKLDGIPSFVEAWIDGLRDGLAGGQSAPGRGVANAIGEFGRLLNTPISHDPLAAQEPPTELTASERDVWRDEVITTIRRSVRPALGRLWEFFRAELLPAASSDDEPGLCRLPDGIEAYEHLLWAATTTTHGADAVHELGLAQLARLDVEYSRIGRPALGLDDPRSIRDRLRSDPSLQYASAHDILDDIHSMLERAQSLAPAWFSRLPAASCKTVAVEGGGMAFYTGPSPDGGRDGAFHVNTTEPSWWTRYALAPTTFHETVPGHHLQISLAQELGLHPVLGELEVTAYSEGWGLYAERLADEMGLYATPLQRLGMLAMDSLRASRLVVDTGIHARGWTRQHAIDVLYDNTALARDNVETEVDRYIADPGQAASYMIGRLEIDRLRADATIKLGRRFSLPSFHDIVLHGGSTPLTDLARRVNTWIEATRR